MEAKHKFSNFKRSKFHRMQLIKPEKRAVEISTSLHLQLVLLFVMFSGAESS